jgi:hypothetical protein
MLLLGGMCFNLNCSCYDVVVDSERKENPLGYDIIIERDRTSFIVDHHFLLMTSPSKKSIMHDDGD